MSVKLIWITPDAEKHLAYMGRVSNPANQGNESIEGLIHYMVRNKHWSPFEMVSACFEINTTRDIGRQILRHRSFSFQEFSQRYADVGALPEAEIRECRLQDTKNRQSSLDSDDPVLNEVWNWHQSRLLNEAQQAYQWAIDKGIAKEQARALLPEGLTSSRMYMSGSLRSWMHYYQLRCAPETQKEHRLIATEISEVLAKELPVSWAAIKASV